MKDLMFLPCMGAATVFMAMAVRLMDAGYYGAFFVAAVITFGALFMGIHLTSDEEV
jgi:hypothetical protein